jgi:hypothetical protein
MEPQRDNAAEIFNAEEQGKWEALPQWSRGASAAEIDTPELPASPDVDASMEPWLDAAETCTRS